MRARLDDNAQEALQFLLLGAGIILAGRLLHHGLDLAWAPGADAPAWERAIEPFRHGYLVPRGTLVSTAVDLAARLGVGALLTLVGGGLGALMGSAVARVGGRPALRGTVRGARWGLALAGAWCLYATLALPPRTVRAIEQGLLVRERAAVLNAVALPVPARDHLLPWKQVRGFEHQPEHAPGQGCGTAHAVVAVGAATTDRLAVQVPGGRHCSEAGALAEQACTDLVRTLRAMSDL